MLAAFDALRLVSKAYLLPRKWIPLGPHDVALITGGLCGLGLELVKKLHSEYRVGRIVVLDVVKPSLDAYADSGSIDFRQCDISLPANLQSTLDALLTELHSQGLRISVVVNNAGIRNSGLLLCLDENQIRSAFEVNTLAPITILRKVISHHLSHYAERQLYVVGVSSILAALAPKNLSVYSASKAATFQVYEALTQELIHLPNIRLLLVATGQLTTSMFHDVTPNRLFFAPLVDHAALAAKILRKANRGECGVLCEPVYANFLPIVKVLPVFIQQLCRWFSRMDDQLPDR